MSLSNTAAVVASTRDAKHSTRPIATPPAMSSLPRTAMNRYVTAAPIITASVMAQYLVVRKALTEFSENA